MPIDREPESIDNYAPEESAVRRAPLDQDDAYELADHEFTLVAEDAADDSRGWPYDEHTAPWSTLPPLPAWATKARALLEPPTLPRPLNDETPTLVEEADHVSATALRALRTEIGQLLSDADARGEQIDQLERSLASAVQARAESEWKTGNHATELSARAQVQALRIEELEDELRVLKAAPNARVAELEAELRELKAARDAREANLEGEVRDLKAARDAREAELEHEVRELKAVHEVRAAALDELRAHSAAHEKRVAELEAERRELKSTRKAARAAEAEELRLLKAAHTTQAAELERLRALETVHRAQVAELAQLRALEAAKTTQAAELKRLRRLEAAQTDQATELDRLRAIATAHTTQAAEIEQLRALAAAHAAQSTEQAATLSELRELRASLATAATMLDEERDRRSALEKRAATLESELEESKATRSAHFAELDDELSSLRAADEARAVELSELRAHQATLATEAAPLAEERELRTALEKRAAELEGELRELRLALQLALSREFDVATGIPSDSEADIETTAEWISNAPPGLEVTIEVDANDDGDILVATATSGHSTPELETTGDTSISERETEGAGSLQPTAAATDDDGAAQQLAAEARDSESPTLVETDDAGELETALPSPETTIEIDPDSDLFELDAAMPPLPAEAQTAAPSSKQRKRRQPRKPRKRPAKPRAVPRDDFQRIDGIGKSLEQRLHAKGIQTYAQLAALRPTDLAKVAKQIGVTPERIARESWLAQARRLKKRPAKPAAAAKPRKQKRARA